MKAGRLLKLFIALAASGSIAVSAPGAVAQSSGTTSSETQTRDYVGITGYYHSLNLCEDWPGGNPNVGVVCFERTPGDFVEIEIQDATGLPVAGQAQFLVNGELSYDTTRICGREPVRIPVQPGWDRLYIWLAGPIESAWCVGSSLSSFATKGTVTATFMSAKSAAASRGALSGRILGGLGFMPPQSCEDLPDCFAWLQRDCSSALAGRDPAWLTSIEDIAELADGTTARSFEVAAADRLGNVAGGAVIQFWRADCTEISSRRTATTGRAMFRIPSSARWMTVAASDNRDVVWRLI